MGAPVRPRVSADVEAYAAAAESFAAAVAESDLRAEVAGCPGWSVLDLVVHLGNVHAWAATIVETGRSTPEQDDAPRSQRPRAVGQWYAAKAEDLYQVLRQAPLERACWNFVDGAGTVAFWPRRQLHETTVHHVDLDLACDRTPVVAPAVAADGVGEVLGVLVRRMHARGHPAQLQEPLALTANDTGTTWVVVPQDGPPLLESVGPSRPEVRDRVEAPVEVLYRLLWRRPVDRDLLTLRGDPARVEAFLGSRLAP